MKKIRSFTGTNNARKAEARIRIDIIEAIEYGITSNIANKLALRGKTRKNNLPDIEDNIFTNRGNGQNYGPRQKKKGYTRESIRENPLTDDDFYDEID